MESATAEPLPGGRYRVTAKIQAGSRSDPGDGTLVTEAPLDEGHGRGHFADHLLDSGVTPLYAGKHRLRGGLAELPFEM